MFVQDQTVVCGIKGWFRVRNALQSGICRRLKAFNARRISIVANCPFLTSWYANLTKCSAGTKRRIERAASAYRPARYWHLHHFFWVTSLCFACLLTASANTFAASGRVTVDSGGVSRAAILVEHARLKKSRRPVIVILHGGGGNAQRVRHMLGLEEKARSASPVMVYPEAIDKAWGSAAISGDGKDSIFIHDLIVKLISEGIADKHRIFIVGGSSGGLLALKVACSGSVELAGVVAIFANLPAGVAANCKLAHPTPFLLILGTMDTMVPYNGGAANLIDSKAELLSGKETLDFFGKAAGCGEGHTTIAYADHDTRDNSRAYLDKLTGCKVPVELLRIEGGGHLLPRIGPLGTAARALDSDRTLAPGLRNRDVDAPLLIWDFLRHLGA